MNLFAPASSGADRTSWTDDYRRTIRALSRASVSVYPVDAKGLVAQGSALSTGPQSRYDQPSTDQVMSLQQSRQGLVEIAESTGGRAYFDRNDLHRSMTEAMEDARHSYTLAYYQPGEPDDTLRRIQVRIRRNGVKARARTGYVAVRQAASAEEGLRRALLSPLDATAIGLAGALEEQPDGSWKALLQIDPGNVGFTPEREGYRCRLDVVTVLRDAAGKPVGKSLIDRLDLLLEGKALRGTQENGVIWRTSISASPTAVDVRFGVRDLLTGLWRRCPFP